MLKIGDSLPNIEISDQSGKTVNLFQLSNKEGKSIVVFFYPKDMTPGCTKEACNFRDNFQKYQDKDVLIFGVSKDGAKSHLKFIEKYNLPFPLLSDPDLKLTKSFGAYGKKRTGNMGLIRSTFVTDKNGKISAIFGLKDTPKVNTAIHGEEILKVIL